MGCLPVYLPMDGRPNNRTPILAVWPISRGGVVWPALSKKAGLIPGAVRTEFTVRTDFCANIERGQPLSPSLATFLATFSPLFFGQKCPSSLRRCVAASLRHFVARNHTGCHASRPR